MKKDEKINKENIETKEEKKDIKSKDKKDVNKSENKEGAASKKEQNLEEKKDTNKKNNKDIEKEDKKDANKSENKESADSKKEQNLEEKKDTNKKNNKNIKKENKKDVRKSKNKKSRDSKKKQNPEEKEEANKNKDKKERSEEIKDKLIKSRKKKIICLLIMAIILVIAFIVSTGLALLNINNTRIISGISINGVDVSELTTEEALAKLNEIAEQKLEGTILIKASDEFEYEIQLSQIETSYDIEKALEEAYNVGRDGNIFVNNYEIAKAMIFGKDIDLEYTYNEELLDSMVDDISSKVPDGVVEPSYYIEDETLIIIRGTSGNGIDEEELKQKIIDTILTANNDEEIDIEFIEVEPSEIDIDAIYEEVYTEPQDAYYTEDPFEIFPHVNGIDFDLEAAREMLKEEKDEYEIELIITEPDITTDELGEEAFPDLLSSFSTKYDASNTNRTTNLELAMAKIDGVVVAAGETFSFNETVGKRTVEAGYKEAGGYAGGKVVQTLAGGICQISSTLYDAVVYANLEIVERHNHMFLAGYVGAGKDATVVYGSLDFQFKNTRSYPIMIKASIGNGVAKIEIYGIKEEVEYDVDIVTTILSYTSYDVEYEEDSTLEEGTQKVTQSGMNGCKSITYKVLKLNGTEVSRTVLSSDTYDPLDEIITVGTKKTSSSSTSSSTTKETTQTNSSTNSTTNSTTDTENNTTSNET